VGLVLVLKEVERDQGLGSRFVKGGVEETRKRSMGESWLDNLFA
jgi:hypothetical protein